MDGRTHWMKDVSNPVYSRSLDVEIIPIRSADVNCAIKPLFFFFFGGLEFSNRYLKYCRILIIRRLVSISVVCYSLSTVLPWFYFTPQVRTQAFKTSLKRRLI